MLKLCKVYGCTNETLGLHLSRAPWDPYPWVSDIQLGSSAQRAGMRTGDTVLELNGCDILGQKISEIATHIRAHWNSGATYIMVIIWRNNSAGFGVGGESHDDDSEDAEGGGTDHSINQQSLQKFATCLQHIAQLLECPVCLEVIKPPGWQCCNGHVLCNNCRSRSVKCPVCRVPLGPRGRCLLSDKLFTLLAESFPCDGIKSHRNSSTEGQKCTPDFHKHPKMAVATTMQKKIKAKEIKAKAISLRHQDENPNSFQAQNEEKGEIKNKAGEKLPLDKVDRKNVITQTSAGRGGGGDLRACRNLRCTSRTSKVHQQHQQMNDGVKIVKSHVDDDSQDDGDDYDKHLPNCSGNSSSNSSSNSSNSNSSSGDESSETAVSCAKRQGTTSSRENNNNHNNSSNNNKKLLVKLALNSSKKNQKDYCEPRWGHKITAQSHELLDDEVTIVNNGMPTNRVRQQQQQQQQQYQNYHCPTGKSCCSYVETSDSALQVLTKTTTTTTTSMKNPAIGRGFVGNYNKKNINNNNNNNSNNFSTMWTTMSVRLATQDEEKGGAGPDAPLVFCSTSLSNFSGRAAAGSSSCHKSLMPELQQGTHTVPAAARIEPSHPSPPNGSTNTTSQNISARVAATTRLRLRTEWQILTHLTREHRLAVSQFYGTYGQRIQVDFMHNKSMACLNLRLGGEEDENPKEQLQQLEYTDAGVLNYENVNNYKANTFFLACLPLNSGSDVVYASSFSGCSTTSSKFGIFLWHLPAAPAAAAGDTGDVCNFATIIESKRTGIKWFGRSHPLAKSWSQIHAEGHFLVHEMPARTDEQTATDAFDIVIRIK